MSRGCCAADYRLPLASSDEAQPALGATPSDFRGLPRVGPTGPAASAIRHLDGGAYQESTLAANQATLRAIELHQRVLRDVSQISTAVTILGRTWTLPLALAPVELAGMHVPRAEVQASAAAQAVGVPFCESTVSIASLEEVARATTAPWFQLYVMRSDLHRISAGAGHRCRVHHLGAARGHARGGRPLPWSRITEVAS